MTQQSAAGLLGKPDQALCQPGLSRIGSDERVQGVERRLALALVLVPELLGQRAQALDLRRVLGQHRGVLGARPGRRQRQAKRQDYVRIRKLGCSPV